MLKKYQGSFRRSLDESLNLVWIQNNHIVHKGVDGFFQEAPKIRKRKDRNISHTNLFYEYESQQDLPLPQKNVWQINEGQINFIASRVRLSESLVRSTYHKAGSSVRLTILGLCKVDTGDISGVSINDITLQVNAAELGQEFPHLSNDQCLSLIILTHPFTARAHELAKVICTSSSISSSAPASSTKLIPHYAPAKLGNDATIVTREDQPSNVKNLSQTNLNQAAIKHALHREQMFSKANVAWRKSRSNHLMGGAAAYYGEEGRKADAANRAYSSAIADAQVHSTATSSSIDLHGVNVQDAVRNAKDAVQRWWNTGQAEWAREGKAPGGNGYTIITGAGTHSQGGKARIRPAVINMLKTEGWRVEEDAVRGQLIVLGRSRIR